jgi:hypothetical protein
LTAGSDVDVLVSNADIFHAKAFLTTRSTSAPLARSAAAE